MDDWVSSSILASIFIQITVLKDLSRYIKYSIVIVVKLLQFIIWWILNNLVHCLLNFIFVSCSLTQLGMGLWICHLGLLLQRFFISPRLVVIASLIQITLQAYFFQSRFCPRRRVLRFPRVNLLNIIEQDHARSLIALSVLRLQWLTLLLSVRHKIAHAQIWLGPDHLGAHTHTFGAPQILLSSLAISVAFTTTALIIAIHWLRHIKCRLLFDRLKVMVHFCDWSKEPWLVKDLAVFVVVVARFVFVKTGEAIRHPHWVFDLLIEIGLDRWRGSHLISV